jgi:DNA-binding PadR family transcriptional regulator
MIAPRKPSPVKGLILTVPEITHLQAFVLFQIDRGQALGKALRKALRTEQISQQVPTFRACIRRLERDGLIVGRYVRASGGARGRERSYALTAAGRKALKDVRRFYGRLGVSDD